ncbi:hypothetical protein [Absidia glauca]|uniref:HMG box domain-containing protein n=1 Tax=Absidia glauca TaxID=4829 RepID=A0A168S2R8_ABSGL|nr:hypothetical protein [Absidia glauca]
MPSLQSFMHPHYSWPESKVDLPPLVLDVKRTIQPAACPAITPPAFLEPHPQLTLEPHHQDKIRIPQLQHRSSFGSLSSSLSDQSLEDEPPSFVGDESSPHSNIEGMYGLRLQPLNVSPTPSFPANPRSAISVTPHDDHQQHEFVTKGAHIKRPRNAWIHFRCYFGQALKAKEPTIRAEEISKLASSYWARLTCKQKRPWHVMAEQEKLAHQEAFPNYRYRPKRALPKSVVLASDQCSINSKKGR